MIVQKVTLVFPSLNQLWSFVREARVNYSDLDETKFSLECNCNETEIEMAKEKYDAQAR